MCFKISTVVCAAKSQLRLAIILCPSPYKAFLPLLSTSQTPGYFGSDHGEVVQVLGSLAIVEFKSGRSSVGNPPSFRSSLILDPPLLTCHPAQAVFCGSLGIWQPLACPCRMN